MNRMSRFVLAVCFALPLAAQTPATLYSKNGWTQTVNAGFPANYDTQITIVFQQGSTNLANTPITVSGVSIATLQPGQGNVLVVKLTPVNPNDRHGIEEANRFLNTKPPTGEFCLDVMTTTYKKKPALRLVNGMIVAAAGNLSVLPKPGTPACLCGKGLPATKESEIEIFEVKGRCPAAKPPAKKK